MILLSCAHIHSVSTPGCVDLPSPRGKELLSIACQASFLSVLDATLWWLQIAKMTHLSQTTTYVARFPLPCAPPSAATSLSSRRDISRSVFSGPVSGLCNSSPSSEMAALTYLDSLPSGREHQPWIFSQSNSCLCFLKIWKSHDTKQQWRYGNANVHTVTQAE